MGKFPLDPFFSFEKIYTCTIIIINKNYRLDLTKANLNGKIYLKIFFDKNEKF